ncbi:MAG: V-type ATP synthase subunit E family protein [Candidatus Diapherotrites archaeon]|nr:V-type ATP synthase subunit E family protein [Candidatus Diapherotrites archaeon]
MGLEKVIQEIKEQTENECKNILKQASETRQHIIQEANAQAEQFKQQASKESDLLAEEIKNKELSQHRLEQNKKIMETKSKAVQEIFQTALEKTKTLSENQRKQLLKKLLEKGLKELENAKYVYTNKQDTKLVQELAKQLKHAGEIQCTSGIVLENADKTIKVNYTFEVLFEKTKEENLHEISNDAF